MKLKCQLWAWSPFAAAFLLAFVAAPSWADEGDDAIALLEIALKCPVPPYDSTTSDERDRGEKWLQSRVNRYTGTGDEFSIVSRKNYVDESGKAQSIRRLIFSEVYGNYSEMILPMRKDPEILKLRCKDAEMCLHFRELRDHYNPCEGEPSKCDDKTESMFEKYDSLNIRFCDATSADDAEAALKVLINAKQ